jgi:hypothetical protein
MEDNDEEGSSPKRKADSAPLDSVDLVKKKPSRRSGRGVKTTSLNEDDEIGTVFVYFLNKINRVSPQTTTTRLSFDLGKSNCTMALERCRPYLR